MSADARTVLSTYRLQMRGDAFTFADAEKIVDYLDDLGVSHLYLSPILTASQGSTHGYDVTDPTTVSDAIGGPDGLARLARAAHDKGLGVIVDIVPNHVGVDRPEENPWWWDVLRNGRDSQYATYFDIDWSVDPEGRIILPVLGSDDDVAELTVDGDVLRIWDKEFPIAPGTGDGTGPEVHDRQHYRLVGWRNGVCGYRRFFTVTSLAGLRQEDPAVFDATHTEVRRWFDDGVVDGLRIDHPDGLTNPAGYLARLRALTGEGAWIVIEKILAPDEALEPTLPVEGTTGYDALRDIGGLFVNPSGERALTDLYESTGVTYYATPALVRNLKSDRATDALGSELRRLTRRVVETTGADHPLLPDAIAALLTHIAVYRSDYLGLAALLSTAIAEAVSAEPELEAPMQIVAAAVTGDDEASARLQQLCGATTAKAVEDCLFYRDARLVSLNEVGGEPERFGVSSAEFHNSAATRARLWPQAMVTLTTHDTKRGEDVRARIGVLSQVPDRWRDAVARWEQVSPCTDRATGLFLWQNIFGVWPADGDVTDEFRQRIHGYAEKAIREAAVHTSWNNQNEEFEAEIHRWIDGVLDGPVAAELTTLVAELSPHAHSDSLGQKLISLTSPGVPDVYQGTEIWEDSLVDPDNRRPVDYAERREALSSGHPKTAVVAAALRLRRARPETFLQGTYTPLLAAGSAASHLIAFRRGEDVVVAVTRWTVSLDGWDDTSLALPPGRWVDRITDTEFSETVSAAELFRSSPVALLERVDA